MYKERSNEHTFSYIRESWSYTRFLLSFHFFLTVQSLTSITSREIVHLIWKENPASERPLILSDPVSPPIYPVPARNYYFLDIFLHF